MSDSKIATAGVNASGDTEERTLATDPQHAPAVAYVYRTFQVGEWYYANFQMYGGQRGVWLPEAEYERLIAAQVQP